MPLYVRDERVNQLAEQAQKILKASTKTDAIRQALERIVEAEEQRRPLAERLEKIKQRYQAMGTDDPDNEADRAYLLSYSPLHQVKPASEQTYPPVYIESSSNDDRVHPSHARRFAKCLEDAGHMPLFHEFVSGGHGGAGNSAEMAGRTAMGYSFLRQTIMKA